MPHGTRAERVDVSTALGSMAGTSGRTGSSAILVEGRKAEAGLGGCGSAAAGFGAGGLIALPVLLAAALLRRRASRSSR